MVFGGSYHKVQQGKNLISQGKKLSPDHPAYLKERGLQVKKILERANKVNNMDPMSKYSQQTRNNSSMDNPSAKQSAANLGPGFFVSPEIHLMSAAP